MTIPFSFSLSRRGPVFSLLAIAWLLMWNRQLTYAQVIGGVCQSTCPDPTGRTCATYTVWDTGSDINIRGLKPQSIQDDRTGITNQLSPAAPTMVTSMENTCNGSSGLMYWSPATNAFKTFCVTSIGGGFQFSVDLNRSTRSSTESDDQDHESDYENHRFGEYSVDLNRSTKSSAESDDQDHTSGYGNHAFGAGDVWATVHSNADFAPYMNFRGSGNFTRWNVGADTATGIRVNPVNGKVYFANFGDGSSVHAEPPEIIELDPATNKVRKWQTGNKPYQLFFDGTFVWATAAAGETLPFDQILRLDPSAGWGNNLTRWNLASGSFQNLVVSGTNPNDITTDLEGKVWFTETAANKVGRLDPTANTVTEYIKGSIMAPQNIASSGTHAMLQAFFTEDTGNTVDVLTNSVATSPGGSAGVAVPVTPASSFVKPSTSTAKPVAFTPNAFTTTITPTTCQVTGVDSTGIISFPAPITNSEPAGITPVVAPHSVLGTLRLSGHVFQLSSSAIIAPPPPASACRDEDAEADDDAKHDGGKTSGNMHEKECEDSDKEMERKNHYK